jgi:carbonic anhydrase/acetyltransferase-like protein (isoleucine patch superfamily)
MSRYELGELRPTVDESASIADDAVLVGDVTVGASTVIGAKVVIRADQGPILVSDGVVIGPRTVIHVAPASSTTLEAGVVIGSAVHIESSHVMTGAVIGDRCVLLPGSVVSAGAFVAPLSVVVEGAVVDEGSRVAGVPARPVVEQAQSGDEAV